MSSSSSSKTDKEVQQAIRHALTQTSTPIKPNKVRKWVCNKIAKGATWTQFAEALEHLIATKQVVEVKQDDGETYLQPIVDTQMEEIKTRKKEEKGGSKKEEEEEEASKEQVEIKVPNDIIHHLTRKGKRKQKNIETSTKTKLLLTSSSSSSIQIVGDAQNHIQAAKLMIDKMLESYQNHPDRFQYGKKAGGTLEEQAKIREEKERIRKLKRHHYDKRDQQKEEEREKTKKKKKKRKFY